MNICVDCQRPIGFCSWEKNFTPVPGWTATETVILVSSPSLWEEARFTKSYDVKDCPLFVPPPGYTGPKASRAKSVIARNIATGDETIFPSIKKASVALGVSDRTVTKYIAHGGILYGNRLRYEKVGDGE